MWLRDPVPIEVSQNAVMPIGFQLWDEAADIALDISGWSLVCNVAPVDGVGAALTHLVDITDPDNGEFDIVFDGSQYQDAGQGEVTYSYEVKADDGSGQSVIVMRGPINLVPGIG